MPRIIVPASASDVPLFRIRRRWKGHISVTLTHSGFCVGSKQLFLIKNFPTSHVCLPGPERDAPVRTPKIPATTHFSKSPLRLDEGTRDGQRVLQTSCAGGRPILARAIPSSNQPSLGGLPFPIIVSVLRLPPLSCRRLRSSDASPPLRLARTLHVRPILSAPVQGEYCAWCGQTEFVRESSEGG